MPTSIVVCSFLTLFSENDLLCILGSVISGYPHFAPGRVPTGTIRELEVWGQFKAVFHSYYAMGI